MEAFGIDSEAVGVEASESVEGVLGREGGGEDGRMETG